MIFLVGPARQRDLAASCRVLSMLKPPARGAHVLSRITCTAERNTFRLKPLEGAAIMGFSPQITPSTQLLAAVA